MGNFTLGDNGHSPVLASSSDMFRPIVCKKKYLTDYKQDYNDYYIVHACTSWKTEPTSQTIHWSLSPEQTCWSDKK